MCGIGGLIRLSGLTPADHGRANRLRTLLHHRGPDGAGVAFTPVAALVQTRLALVDPEPYELPMQRDAARYTFVFNGELYNYKELRQQLAPFHQFRTQTDSEVAFAALLQWGVAALSRFEGMFALFLWDDAERTGLAAVDPLSVKPLLYHSGAGQFLFGSEAGPLLEAGLLPFRPDEEAIAESLIAPYFSGTHSLPFSNLRRLLPGHFLQISGDRVLTSKYRSAAVAPDALLPALRRAVVAQSTADAPVGLFLSGGVDSSLLAAFAPEHTPAFTIQYPHEPGDFAGSLIVKSDDVPFAQQVAGHFRLPHHLIMPESFERALLRTLTANDLISAWEQEVSQNVLAEAAAPFVKAVLVGDAADETHFGYSFLLHPERLWSPRPLLDFFGHLPTRIPVSHFVDRYTGFAKAEGHHWRTPDEQRLAITCLIRHFWLTRLLHNGDIHLMAHSVEGRVPFADPSVLAFAETVPVSAGLANGIEKHHLRAAAAEVLPLEIAWRPKSALTKHLGARNMIHRLFRSAWGRHGAYLEPYIAPDVVESLQAPADDRESGLRFRLLALLTWFARFSELPAA